MADIAISIVTELKRSELEELCDATEAAINSGGYRVSGTQRNAVVAYRRDP